jgi:hypothetical protein
VKKQNEESGPYATATVANDHGARRIGKLFQMVP